MSDMNGALHNPNNPTALEEKEKLIEKQQRQIDALKGLLKNEIQHKESISKALRYHLNRNEELVNAVPWIVLLVSENKSYSDVNRYFASLYGLDPHHFTDKLLGSMNEDPALVSTISSFIEKEQNQTSTHELGFQTQLGYQHFLFILFRNSIGGHTTVIGIDITDRIQAETALRTMKDKAEKRQRISKKPLPLQMKWLSMQRLRIKRRASFWPR